MSRKVLRALCACGLHSILVENNNFLALTRFYLKPWRQKKVVWFLWRAGQTRLLPVGKIQFERPHSNLEVRVEAPRADIATLSRPLPLPLVRIKSSHWVEVFVWRRSSTFVFSFLLSTDRKGNPIWILPVVHHLSVHISIQWEEEWWATLASWMFRGCTQP